MSATFSKAARYWVTARCLTPFRTGGVEAAVDSVLRDWSGCPFIQGTSLAGAFRGWLESRDPEEAERLFGSQQVGGSLIISDGMFQPKARQYIRPRLRLDGATGAADDRGKFDMAHIAPGETLTFELVWLGEEATQSQLESVEQLLAALHAGEIRLGAQKTNGFGRVELTVKKRRYSLEQEEDRIAWLEDREDGHELQLPPLYRRNQVVFTVDGRTDAILVKSGSRELRGVRGSKRSVITPLEEEGQAIVPGSSVKGAVRARVTAIASLLGLDETVIHGLFGRGVQGKQDGTHDDNGMQGQVWFEDVHLSGKKREITRIRINRLTGGVIRQGLFVEEPLESAVTLRIALPAEETVGCALLLYALRDLGLGLYNLGSGGAVGRGYLTVDTIQAQGPDGETATLRFDRERNCTMYDPSGLFSRWLNAIGGDEM